MSLLAQCETCGKRYTVGDQFAGRRAKCKACGGIVSIPTSDLPKPDNGPDLDVFAPAAPAPARPTAAGRPSTGRPASAAKPPPPPPQFDIAPEAPPPPPDRRGQYDDLVFNGLPILFIVAGYGIPLGIFIWHFLQTYPNNGLLILMASLLVLFCAVVIPLANVGLKVGAHARKLVLYTSPYLRTTAAFATVPVLLYLLVVNSDHPDPYDSANHTGTIFAAFLLGAIPAYFFIWLQLRTDLQRSAVVWGIGLIGYFAGIFATYGVLKVESSLMDSWHKDYFTSTTLWPRPGQSSGSTPPAGQTPPPSQPGPSSPVPSIDAQRNQSADNLRQIGLALVAYASAHANKPPPDLNTLVAAGLPAQAIKSPFGDPASGPDYVYLLHGAGSEDPPIMLAYDQAEHEKDDRTAILDSTGAVSSVMNSQFADSLAYTNRTITQEANAALSPAQRAAATLINLRQIDVAIRDYARQHDHHYPPDWNALVASSSRPLPTDSPYGHPSSGPDYVYLINGQSIPVGAVPHDVIVAYDAGQHEHDASTTVDRGDGTIEVIPNSQMPALLATASSFMSNPTGWAPPPPPPPPVVQIPPWNAKPDPALPHSEIHPNLVLYIPHSADILYPVQFGSVVGAGDDFSGNSSTATDVHETWNLGTKSRIGHIQGALPLQNAVISPDGSYITGSLGTGQNVQTLYQVWSFNFGRLYQAIAQLPSHDNPNPRAVGYLEGDNSDDDSIVLLGDGIDVCNLKTGNLTRHIPLDTPPTAETSVGISPTGRLVALWNKDGVITMVDTVAGKALGGVRFPVDNFRGGDLAFSPDGTQLAAFAPSGELRAYSVASAKTLADYTTSFTFETSFNGRHDSLPLVWLPGSNGWILGGKTIVDEPTGVSLYPIPNQSVAHAEEFGPRMLIDDQHVLMSFKASNDVFGFCAYLIPGDALVKARNAAHAAAGLPH